jgi:hypothetical protein
MSIQGVLQPQVSPKTASTRRDVPSPEWTRRPAHQSHRDSAEKTREQAWLCGGLHALEPANLGPLIFARWLISDK